MALAIPLGNTPIGEVAGREWAFQLRELAKETKATGQDARARELDRLAAATEAEVKTMHDARMRRIERARIAAAEWARLSGDRS
jgi:hypothetical protein